MCHAFPCCLMALAAWPRPVLSRVKLAQPLKLWNKPVCTSVTRTGSPKKPCYDDDLCLSVHHQQVPRVSVSRMSRLSNGSDCLAMARASVGGAALAATTME